MAKFGFLAKLKKKIISYLSAGSFLKNHSYALKQTK